MEPCLLCDVRCKVGKCHVPVTDVQAGHDESAGSAVTLRTGEDLAKGFCAPIMPGLLGRVQG